MMKAAAETAAAEAERLGVARPRLLGVTVLTSLDKSDLEATGVPADPTEQACGWRCWRARAASTA